MKNKLIYACITLLLMEWLFTSCFTGIESTKKITDRDVVRVTQGKEIQTSIESQYNNVVIDSFPNWSKGKRFEVVDDNLKRVLTPMTGVNVDTLMLKGRMLEYVGYYEESVLDNEPNVNLRFSDGVNEFVYRTHKTIEQIEKGKILLQVPFLIDVEMVETYRERLVGNEFYLRTSIWYDENGVMIPGKKYVKVKIVNVQSGDKVFPMRVAFETTNGEMAYVFMSINQSSVQNRLFDDLFSETDIRKNYPLISDENWENIINGTISLAMTKDECRLSLGNPGNIQEHPTNDGLLEYWFYSDGMYLVFFDGLLKQYRK